MEYYLLIILIVVIKIVFWTIYCIVRSQRSKTRQIVIVEAGATGHRPRVINSSDRARIVRNEEIPQHSLPPPTYNTPPPPTYTVPLPTYNQAVMQGADKPRIV